MSRIPKRPDVEAFTRFRAMPGPEEQTNRFVLVVLAFVSLLLGAVSFKKVQQSNTLD